MPGRKLPEAARREDILRAAYDVAARRGIHALTLRAVAERAAVSHGTVLFHFRRRDELVATLLERVLEATAALDVPEGVQRLAGPSDRLLAVLREEIDRLSADPRHFRLFLEYWALGVRNPTIRRTVSGALERYRAGFRELAGAVLEAAAGPRSRSGTAVPRERAPTASGIAAVAVSLVHGSALQSVIDPKGFDVEQHFAAAARMVDALPSSLRG